MIELQLSEADAAVLRETIRTVLNDLSYEIANTDSQDWRDTLKARRDVLTRLERTLAGAGPATQR